MATKTRISQINKFKKILKTNKNTKKAVFLRDPQKKLPVAPLQYLFSASPLNKNSRFLMRHTAAQNENYISQHPLKSHVIKFWPMECEACPVHVHSVTLVKERDASISSTPTLSFYIWEVGQQRHNMDHEDQATP